MATTMYHNLSDKVTSSVFGGGLGRNTSYLSSESDTHSLKSFWNVVRSSAGGNSLDYKLFEAIGALEKLKNLPEEHDFYVQPEVANIAANLLSYLSYVYGVDSPKLLPENDECVSLVWDDKQVTKYIAVYKDAIDLMLYNKYLKISCNDYLCSDGDLDFDHVGKTLSKSGKAKSTTAV